jgi:hypothetical protein
LGSTCVDSATIDWVMISMSTPSEPAISTIRSTPVSRDRAQAIGHARDVADHGEAIDERIGQRARVRREARAVMGHVVVRGEVEHRPALRVSRPWLAAPAVHAREARRHRAAAAHGLARDLESGRSRRR